MLTSHPALDLTAISQGECEEGDEGSGTEGGEGRGRMRSWTPFLPSAPLFHPFPPFLTAHAPIASFSCSPLTTSWTPPSSWTTTAAKGYWTSSFKLSPPLRCSPLFHPFLPPLAPSLILLLPQPFDDIFDATLTFVDDDSYDGVLDQLYGSEGEAAAWAAARWESEGQQESEAVSKVQWSGVRSGMLSLVSRLAAASTLFYLTVANSAH